MEIMSISKINYIITGMLLIIIKGGAKPHHEYILLIIHLNMCNIFS